jgi:hypothetical protein
LQQSTIGHSPSGRKTQAAPGNARMDSCMTIWSAALFFLYLSFATNSISSSVGIASNSEFLGNSKRTNTLPGAASLGTRTGP